MKLLCYVGASWGSIRVEPAGSAVGACCGTAVVSGPACRLLWPFISAWRPGILLSVEVLGGVVAALVVSRLECDALVASCLWASSALVSRAL